MLTRFYRMSTIHNNLGDKTGKFEVKIKLSRKSGIDKAK